MNKATPSLQLFLNLFKAQATLSRRFEGYLDGLSINEFIILHHLNQARDHKMRRIDLADKICLSASGITRLLNPMEKIGLVGREANTRDARSTFVTLSTGGRRKLHQALSQANLFCQEIIEPALGSKLESVSAHLSQLSS